MATKDISDEQVCLAYLKYQKPSPMNFPYWPEEHLMIMTLQPKKVCFSAMKRADRRGYLDYGVNLHSGWLTDKGKRLVRKHKESQMLDHVTKDEFFSAIDAVKIITAVREYEDDGWVVYDADIAGTWEEIAFYDHILEEYVIHQD